jgi:hypothetical protein
MAQFNELLAQFLHIRNELTELERREKEAKTKMAEMAKGKFMDYLVQLIPLF